MLAVMVDLDTVSLEKKIFANAVQTLFKDRHHSVCPKPYWFTVVCQFCH